MPLRAMFILIAALCCNTALAGLDEGLDALRRDDFATAAKELRPLAERGNAEAQYRIGLMYEFGKASSGSRRRRRRTTPMHKRNSGSSTPSATA